MASGNFYTRFADGESVAPIFPGSTIKEFDNCYYHDDSGVRYIRPVSDETLLNILVAAAAYAGVALGAGVGNDGDSVTVKNSGTCKRELDGGGTLLAGEALKFSDDGVNLKAQLMKVSSLNNQVVGIVAQSGKNDIPMKIQANALIDGMLAP